MAAPRPEAPPVMTAEMLEESFMAEAYIVAAARTAGGRRGGRLSGWHPADLAAQVIDALLERTNADPALVDDVIMGCVLQAGEQSGCIGRMAVLASKLPKAVPGVTIDRQCGSSQQALHFAAQAVMSGTMDCVIAAGVESMSRIPMAALSGIYKEAGLGHYMSPTIRARYPGPEFSQFMGAEMMAEKYQLSRDALDCYSLQSHQRASAATRDGAFAAEIVPVAVRVAGGPGRRCDACGGRRHPHGRDARRHSRREAAARRRPHHGRQRQPDLRRRERRGRGQRSRSEGDGRRTHWRAFTT